LRTKTFEIKYHLTVIELCPGRASETVFFGTLVMVEMGRSIPS
jgi:hypothetical protein